jgi:chromosome partitioning protein
MALRGLERMLQPLQMVFKSLKKNPDYLIVPTMFDKRTKAAQDSLVLLHQKYPENIWQSVIPVDTKIRDASTLGIPISIYEENAKSSKAYAELLTLLLEGNKAKFKS